MKTHYMERFYWTQSIFSNDLKNYGEQILNKDNYCKIEGILYYYYNN